MGNGKWETLKGSRKQKLELFLKEMVSEKTFVCFFSVSGVSGQKKHNRSQIT